MLAQELRSFECTDGYTTLEGPDKKERLLGELNTELGYDAIEQELEFFLLQQETEHLDEILESVEHSLGALATYRTLAMSDIESNAIDSIETVILEYKTASEELISKAKDST